jgi:hypothetical protein
VEEFAPQIRAKRGREKAQEAQITAEKAQGAQHAAAA